MHFPSFNSTCTPPPTLGIPSGYGEVQAKNFTLFEYAEKPGCGKLSTSQPNDGNINQKTYFSTGHCQTKSRTKKIGCQPIAGLYSKCVNQNQDETTYSPNNQKDV